MIRWCNIPMLLAAFVVAMPGCAQNRTMARAELPSPELAGAERTTQPQDAPAGMREARLGSGSAAVPEVVQTAYSQPARIGLSAAESEAVEYHADEFQLNDLQVARGAEPDPAPGGEPESGAQSKLTLQYLSRLAIGNHPLLQRDQARITSAAGQALQAGLYPNPTFDTNNPQVFNGPLGTALNVGFTQEIVVKGKLRLDRAAALRAQQQAELAYVADKYALLAQVRNQFYQTLAAQFRVDVLRRLLVVTDASVKTGAERVKATIADKQELLLLQIDDDRVKANLENAIKVLDGERKQLAALVGFPGLVTDQVVGSLTAATPVFDEQAMQEFVTSENAQVQIAKLDIDRNKILLQRAEVEPAPNVIIGPAYQYGLNKTQEQFWMTVVFPIPVSNRNQGNIGSARADIRDATESLSAVQLDLLRRMADSLSGHRGALEQAEKYKTKIIPDARESLRLAKSGYDAGVLEFSVYLQAQRTLIETTQDYVNVLETVWTTAANLSGLLQMDRFP
ncbi:MAG TPA: TolC family protein [Planctomycetaceae bacterium]|jgi:cobalt-zinc-cadmium efflux system outer membrane protein